MSKITYARRLALTALSAAVASGVVVLPATMSYAGTTQAATTTIVTGDPMPPASEPRWGSTGRPPPGDESWWPKKPLHPKRYSSWGRMDRPERFLDRFRPGGYKPRWKYKIPTEPSSVGIRG